ncbi:MAG: hypothetical protein LBM38_02210 [Clostridiales bacterium]|jgi:hypothetical protein|nr:hypothetical protein [Clostridiales bacterium]
MFFVKKQLSQKSQKPQTLPAPPQTPQVSPKTPIVISLAAFGDSSHKQALCLEEYTKIHTHNIHSVQELVEYVRDKKDTMDIRAVILSEIGVPMRSDDHYPLSKEQLTALKFYEYHLDELELTLPVEKHGRRFENLQNYIQLELKLPAFASLDISMREQIDIIKVGKKVVVETPNWVSWTR